ncbi:uncharacterized protein LOC122639949 isoform X3 [Telopea speciosissima]|uniref:uncharacterized protein LOC122639949 isoform X3 n=1 Tax=Telopea speciosissima TaxID=54955 RepID=UPI001CC71900|nr:uncharacterized protein LOC122639949 isoform X3 [Telopea speciosissima]
MLQVNFGLRIFENWVREMKTNSRMRDCWDALNFVCCVEFWRMAVFWTLALVCSYLQLFSRGFFFRISHSYPRCSPPLPTPSSISKTNAPTRPICIIMGVCHPSFIPLLFTFLLPYPLLYPPLMLQATSGLGAASAHALSREGFHVVLGGRSSYLLSKTVEEIRKQNADAHLKAFQGYLQHHVDSQMKAMIMSGTQVDEETLAGKYFSRSKQYPCAHIYEYSKFCLLLFSYELHRRLYLKDKSCKVSVLYVFLNAVDPGVVETNIMREVPSCLSQLAFMVLRLLGLLQSPENGVESIVDATLAPPESSGEYFFGGRGRTVNSSKLSYDRELAEKLWTSSYKLFIESQLVSKDIS